MRVTIQESGRFRAYLETLQHEFEVYLLSQLSERTVRKHSHVIGVFIDFVCFDCGLQDIHEVTRGIARSHFRRWYASKVGAVSEREVDVAIRKFFQFLDAEKGIRNEAVLSSF